MTIYLDHNATTPIAPEVRDAMWPYFEEGFGNPSSAHDFGRAARQAVDRARASADEMGLGNVEVHEALIEAVPVEDASVDVVISNGVIDLVPDKDAVFDEIDRVLRTGGRLQVADVVIHHEVSEDARRRIDLWTG